MIKKKLLATRLKKGLSQEQVADLIGMSQSNYSRIENGLSRITDKEWHRIAKELNVSLDLIYEPECWLNNINEDNTQNKFDIIGKYSSNSEFLFGTMKNYILVLEAEIQKLKEENQTLKNNN